MVHPPWYARGTPIINTRDGPPMALSNKPFFAIRGGPSARGKIPEKYRPWLTLKFFNADRKIDADRQINAVKSLDVDRLEERSAVIVDADRSMDAVRSGERSADDLDFDLSAYAVPDNVKMVDDNVKMDENDDNKKRPFTIDDFQMTNDNK